MKFKFQFQCESQLQICIWLAATASSIKRGQHPRTQERFQEDFGVASGDGVVAESESESELKSKSKWCRLKLKLKSSSSQLHRETDGQTNGRTETLARVAHLTHAINWLELLCRCGSRAGGGGGSVSASCLLPTACPAAAATAGPPAWQ